MIELKIVLTDQRAATENIRKLQENICITRVMELLQGLAVFIAGYGLG